MACGDGASAASDAVIGSTIRVDGAPATVIGVADPRVALPAANIGLWVLMDLDVNGTEPFRLGLEVVARMRAGTSMAAATADATRVIQEVAREYPGPHTPAGLRRVRVSFDRPSDSRRHGRRRQADDRAALGGGAVRVVSHVRERRDTRARAFQRAPVGARGSRRAGREPVAVDWRRARRRARCRRWPAAGSDSCLSGAAVSLFKSLAAGGVCRGQWRELECRHRRCRARDDVALRRRRGRLSARWRRRVKTSSRHFATVVRSPRGASRASGAR